MEGAAAARSQKLRMDHRVPPLFCSKQKRKERVDDCPWRPGRASHRILLPRAHSVETLSPRPAYGPLIDPLESIVRCQTYSPRTVAKMRRLPGTRLVLIASAAADGHGV